MLGIDAYGDSIYTLTLALSHQGRGTARGWFHSSREREYEGAGSFLKGEGMRGGGHSSKGATTSMMV
jgi:hypothetical protein